jgi:hypothetical protein
VKPVQSQPGAVEPTHRQPLALAVALTALGLVLPSLFASIALPGLDLEQVRELFGFEARLPVTVTLAAILLVPWVSTAVLVHALAWIIPAWRRPVRSERVARNLSRGVWGVGGLALLVQAFGLALYFEHSSWLVNESWARGLVCCTIVAASLTARVTAVLISKRGLSDGMSVMIAGELLLRLAEEVRAQGGTWLRDSGEQTMLITVLTLAAVVALGAGLSGWLSPRLRARWSVLPMTTPSGLLAAGLAAALMVFVEPPVRASGGAISSPWLQVLDALLSLPLHCRLPPDGEVALSVSALFALVVAMVITPMGTLDRILTSAQIGRPQGRSWFWVATFANASWLLLLVRAAALTHSGSALPWLFVVLFVVHDVWTEWRLSVRGNVATVAVLNGVVAARAAGQLLTSAGIAHALRGMGLRSLFHGFAPFTELEVVVSSADVERAAAALASLIEADRGRASPRTS